MQIYSFQTTKLIKQCYCKPSSKANSVVKDCNSDVNKSNTECKPTYFKQLGRYNNVTVNHYLKQIVQLKMSIPM